MVNFPIRILDFDSHSPAPTKPVSYTASDQSKVVSYTDSSSEEEEDLHVDVNFNKPIDLVIN